MKLRMFFLVLAAVLFVTTGVLHFVRPEPYLKIMPPYIPYHQAMVFWSGVGEVAGGIGLLIPRLRRAAAWGLVALLIAVFPANVYMAMANIEVSGRPLPEWLLWARLPLQGVFIAWVLWASKPADKLAG